MTTTTLGGKAPRASVGLMRIAVGVIIVLALGWATEAHAQPGRAPANAPCDALGDPCGQPIHVTAEESELLRKGYYSDGQIVGGGLIGTFFGLGLGHAVQGRWTESGWKFTLGELGGFGLVMYGIADCVENDRYNDEYGNNDCAWGAIALGAVGMTVFRIWELVDVWAGPSSHNARLRNLRYRLGLDRPPPPPRWGVYAVPPTHGHGAVGGISLRF